VATTLKPKIIVNQFALLKVQHSTTFGAFMDWGLSKELLVPFSEQPYALKEGESYVIYMYFDKISDRLVGSACVEHFLDNTDLSFEPGDEVDMMIYESTELGYKVIINRKHSGLIFKNEVFQPIEIGLQLKGYIKKIREDNKIDVSLYKFGYNNIASNSEKILTYLNNNKGFLNLTDNSKPELIVSQLGMSKKTFKKAVGDLYKRHIVRLDPEGIYLL
jgi:predicted RNA-binding protein (virulence factor B family)